MHLCMPALHGHTHIVHITTIPMQNSVVSWYSMYSASLAVVTSVS